MSPTKENKYVSSREQERKLECRRMTNYLKHDNTMLCLKLLQVWYITSYEIYVNGTSGRKQYLLGCPSANNRTCVVSKDTATTYISLDRL